MNSQGFNAITANTITLPEYNQSSDDVDFSFYGNGTFIVPTANVPDRLNGISGFVLTAQNEDGKLVWQDPTQLGISLEDLSDVRITNRIPNDIVVFDGDFWVNQQIDTSGIKILNGLSTAIQNFQIGNSGSNFNISSVLSTHTFNIPDSSSVNRGLLTPVDWNIFNNKLSTFLTDGMVLIGDTLNVAQEHVIFGDATLTNTGILTLEPSGVIANSYTLTNVIVDSKGRITSASDGNAITSLNSLTDYTQFLVTGTSGSDFNITQYGGNTHNFNLPNSSTSTRGALTSTDWNTFNDKLTSTLADGDIFVGNDSGIATAQTMDGDASISNTGILTLKTIIGVEGDYTNANISVDSKGRVIVAESGLTSNGILSINLLVNQHQTLVTGSDTGVGFTDFAILSSGNTHTFNLPNSSTSTRGALTSTDWNTFNNKLSSTLTDKKIFIGNGGGIAEEQEIYGDATLANDGLLSLSNILSVPPVTYTNANITVDSKGRVTFAEDGSSSGGILSINTLIAAEQSLLTTASGNDFNITQSGIDTHNFNLPNSSTITRGALTSTDWNIFNDKLSSTLANKKIFIGNVIGIATAQDVDGDATISNTGILTLSSIITAGSYTNANITVDSKGRITTASNGPDIGITTINTLTSTSQTLVVGTSGTNFNISSSISTHTFNIPDASGSVGNKGLLTSTQFNTFNNKLSSTLANGKIFIGNGSNTATVQDITGDAMISITGVLTLTTLLVNPINPYTNATISVDAKGRVISISSGSPPATPATPFNSVQFNNGGSFGGTSSLTWNSGTLNVNNTITNTTGNLNLTATGKITAVSGVTNAIEITSGAGSGSTPAGNITIIAGVGGTSSNGGSINIISGNGGSFSGSGGNCNITAGSGNSGNGNVNISSGSPSGSVNVNINGSTGGCYFYQNGNSVLKIPTVQPVNTNYSLMNSDTNGTSYWGLRDYANIQLSTSTQSMALGNDALFTTFFSSSGFNNFDNNCIVLTANKLYSITFFTRVQIAISSTIAGYQFRSSSTNSFSVLTALGPRTYSRDTGVSSAFNNVDNVSFVYSTYSSANRFLRVRLIEGASAVVLQQLGSGVTISQM
jgi:hypothetical protein